MMLLSADTHEKRAKMDLKFHFCKRTLRQWVPQHSAPQRALLHAEYVASKKQSGDQPKAGFEVAKLFYSIIRCAAAPLLNLRVGQGWRSLNVRRRANLYAVLYCVHSAAVLTLHKNQLVTTINLNFNMQHVAGV